ncbi:peroxidase family protein [cf. Phormidesmis sp. LEGE 11477]|uniref:peroxidase family protein n=1 Tax=cf. Phormidesmis sp. LEGE 11477 TaxID=1828680 RepID=UPI00351CC29B
MALRTNDGTGRLKVSDGDLLPINNSETFPDGVLANSNRGLTDPATLFATGDVRANENIGLTAMHTVFVREHNRLADAISAANPELSGEAVYQRARKLVAAQIQHITYSEYLPLLIGDNTIADYAGYDDQVDPSVSHLFSAAAFRMGHTQSSDEFLLIDQNGQALPSVSLNQSTFNPGLVQEQGIDAILRGLFAQTSEAIDTKVLDQLRNTLFGPPGAGGIDLAAVDIQRGRDVGLPDYNQARVDFGLAPVASFAEITSDTDLQAQLEQVYGTVDDIDAIVGGLAEDAVAGSMVGEFFQKVIADQFARLRDGDRFWYENAQFTTEELSLIRETSLSALLERNTEMTGLADNLFSTGRDPAALSAGGTVADQTVTEYATLDGSNNNLANPTLGTPGTHLRVDYTQEYGDGIRTLAGEDRANVREISNTIFAQDGSIPDETGATGFMLAWSQFMGHDMTFAPAGAADTLKVYGTEYESVTGEEFPFVAEKLNLVLGHEVYAGVNNVIERPIYLPALAIDDNVQTTDATGDITVTNASLGAQVFVEANSLTDNRGNEFTGQLSISEVPPELTPAALPENLFPDMVVTIQPGEMVFDTPAQLTLANTAGVEAGTQMDLWSINPTTGDFEIVGVGRVSADGERIETIDGGIRNSSWHFFSDRPLDWAVRTLDHGCVAGSAMSPLTSEVELYSGGLVETHELPTYQSLGEARGVRLVYDSLRADARPVLEVVIDNPSRRGTVLASQLVMTADLSIDINGLEYKHPGFSGKELSPDGRPLVGATGKNFWRLPGESGPVSGKLQADLRSVETGVYNYSMTAGIQGIVPRSTTRRVRNADGSISIITTEFDRLVGTVGSPTNDGAKLIHVNTVDSAFGSGWGIAGMQKLVEGADGSVLLVDGDGTERLFEAPVNAGEAYVSPVGQYSDLVRLEDGTFQLTSQQQTVSRFDQNNRLVSRTDVHGNQTQHVYDAAGQLSKIVDPAGLETTFLYDGDGKVSGIVDPAGRTTQLLYDSAGNLAQVVNPDDSQRTFEYDAGHRMTAEVDQNGRREEAIYDFAGRVASATRKDGSTLEVSPIQTQGLYQTEETTSRFTQAVASSTSDVSYSRYVDGNGNERLSLLDQAGQLISSQDEEGTLTGSVVRDEFNNIIETTDARGFVTRYEYDEVGNVISVSDSLSFDTPELSPQDSEAIVEANEKLGERVDLVATADLNGDDLDDLVVVSGTTASILFINGDRTWSEAVDYEPAEDRSDILTEYADFGDYDEYNTDILIKDIDLDGDRDILIQSQRWLTTLKNDGAGNFERSDSSVNYGQIRNGSSFRQYQNRIDTVDVDGDGRLDLIADGLWYKGNDHGAFSTQGVDFFDRVQNDFISPVFEALNPGYYSTVADFDGDGDLDVVSVGAGYFSDPSDEALEDSLRVLINTGNGNWWNSAAESITLPVRGSSTNNIVSYDIDGDQDLDLVLSASSDDDLYLYTNNGNGVFAAVENAEDFLEERINPETGEVDIIVAETGDVLFYESRRSGTSSNAREDSFRNYMEDSDGTAFANFQISAVEDLDGDGDEDIVAFGGGYQYERHFFIENEGEGGWLLKDAWSLEDGSSINGDNIKVADINQDGFQDIVSLNDLEGLEVRLNTRNNQFSVADTPISDDYYAESFDLVDIDSNGTTDVLFQESSEFYVLLNDGNGHFDAPVSIESNGYIESFITGFIDGNSRIDILTTDSSYSSEDRAYFASVKALFNPIAGAGQANGPLVEQSRSGRGEKSFTYDKTFNQLTSVVDEVGQQTLYEVDETTGNRLAITQVVGQLDTSSDETDDLITTYTYTASGLVDTMTDPLGRTMDYDYDSFGRLAQVTYAKDTAFEASEQFEYDTAGNLSRFVDANGHSTEYIYDAMNRVVTIIEADPDGVAGPLTSPVTLFTYDQAGNITSSTDARGNETAYAYDERDRLVRLVDADQQQTLYDYDDAGNLVATTDALGRIIQHRYDKRNRRIETIDAEGNSTYFTYDLDNNLVEVVDAQGNPTAFTYDARGRLVAETDALSNSTRYAYDAVDSLVAISDRRGNVTRYAYDDLNRLSAAIDPYGNADTFDYDKVGNLITSTDRLGNSTSFGYDARNRLVASTSALEGDNTITYTYDAVGNQLSVTDELNRTTTYVYDALNRLIEATDALNHSTTYDYDEVDNLTKVTDALQRETTYSYDVLNRQVGSVDAAGGSVLFDYDAVGNLTSYTDELDRTTTYQYDRRNLQTQVVGPLETEAGVPIVRTTTTYDSVGNVSTIEDALGQTTTYTYDELYRRTGVTDALGKETVMRYDEAGNLLALTDASGNTTSYAYDALNRMDLDVIEIDGQFLSRSYLYDAVGNLVEQKDRDGRIQSFTYDALNRQTQEQWLDEQRTVVHGIDYTYDAASQLTAVSDPDSTYAYTYDAAGRLLSNDNAGTAGVPDVLLSYGYDAVNNRTSVTDFIMGTQAGVESFTYDTLDRVTRITQSGNGVADKRIDLSYNAASQMTGLSRASDLAGVQTVADTAYTYDTAGRLVGLVHERDGNEIAGYGFTYDAANRLTQLVTPDGTSDYSYNDRDELTGGTHSYQADEAYSYDDTGNRNSAGYETGEQNRLRSDGTYTYEYDNEGNRTRRVAISTGEVTEYGWDYRNRMTSVVTKGSDDVVAKSVEYTYDVYDRRIAKVVDSDGDGIGAATEERYVYDGEHIALVFDGEGNQVSRYLHGPQVDQVLAEEMADGEVRWALSDHQGSVRDLIDSDGEVLNHIVYDSYGQVSSETNADVDFRFGYTGRERDEETGLYYYRARYFDPAPGTFVSTDPLGFDAGDSNIYRYVFNSPTNYTDPSGEVAFTTVAAVVIVGGILVNLFVPPPPAQAPTHCDDIHEDEYFWQRIGVGVLVGGGIERGFSSGASGLASSADDLLRGTGHLLDDAARSLDELFGGGGQRLATAGGGTLDNGVRAASSGADEVGNSVLKSVGDDLGGAADDIRLPSHLQEQIQNLPRPKQRSVRSLYRRAQEHIRKLENYRANPEAADHLGILRNAPNDQVRQNIINGRIRHLEAEISAFEGQIDNIVSGAN